MPDLLARLKLITHPPPAGAGENVEASAPPETYPVEVRLLARPSQPRLMLLEQGTPLLAASLPDVEDEESPLYRAIEAALAQGQRVTIELELQPDGH